jgi:hypothetical protein
MHALQEINIQLCDRLVLDWPCIGVGYQSASYECRLHFHPAGAGP